MSVVLAIGGVLMALHMAKAPALTALVLFGAATALFFGAERIVGAKNGKIQVRNQKTSIFNFQFPISNFLLFALAFLAFASSIMWPLQIDPNDDVVCYLFFPQKILQTGTLIEPFNFRRMGTYGGQALLQALVMIVGGERNGHVPDRGFGMLLLFGMLLHLSKRVPTSLALLRFFAVGCLFFVAVPRINTGSHLTGGALILATIITISKLPMSASARWKAYLAPALLVAGTGSLRMTYLLCVVGIVTIEPFLRYFSNSKHWGIAFKSAFGSVFPVAVGSFILLLPWISVLWQSNGTPMFPPFPGTINPEFTVLGNKGGPLFDAAHAMAFLFTPESLVILFCMGLAGVAKQRSIAYTATLVTVGVSWLVSCKLGVGMFFESQRYTFPMIMPVAIWLIITTLSGETDEGEAPSSTRFSVILTLGMLLALNLPNAGRELGVQAESIPQQITSRERLVNPALTNADRELQNLTPVGTKIFVAVDTPYGFDFARNDIFTADFPGGSAIGRWPLQQGPTALENYLVSHGFKYIIASDFDNAMLLYTRKHWIEHKRPEWFFKEVNGKYFLDFMDNVDSIARTGRVVATAANLRLIELHSPYSK